ncbi:acyl-CoA dehydrogenase family protein [Actinoplanes couchii]|uniref:Acyl-CoA dehydrogenase n=1 Tax=Actinoplanes couchii TaxID=403638 RepID=A0ABQ3XF70_9ACTN|nr:acyl-CoA dehydrogenase family protein [Actinoplanes couchii]MDR6321894.1 alkylation response protein AidB-like acyl-CoA dehydrogenase [Actinoplanes couchii]GID57148.1 acyl-CoA dehydrogenase [Actinoplanes couchii]
MSDEAFRIEVREWLSRYLTDELRGTGGVGRENEAFAPRLAFARRLADGGWTTLAWPVRHGGRGASLSQQVIFHEEYARAGAPSRPDHIGTTMVGPTLMDHGTPEQQRRFLPALAAVDELWCQGYSEPGAGSDLAGLTTRARLDGDRWILNGQKVWTSLAHVADWCFVLARTAPSPVGGPRSAGLSYLLVPMRQPGITVRPIRQLTGDSEFNEVFFDDAVTTADLVVGEPGEGWKVAMGTLAYERGAATVGQQVGFQRDLDDLVAVARQTGAVDDPALRERLTRAWVDLTVLRAHTLRSLTENLPAGPSVIKLLWTRWRQGLGELAMDVLATGPCASDDVERWQRYFLFSRADTIYGGSNEIQRGIIASRVLGLPR